MHRLGLMDMSQFGQICSVEWIPNFVTHGVLYGLKEYTKSFAELCHDN